MDPSTPVLESASDTTIAWLSLLAASLPAFWFTYRAATSVTGAQKLANLALVFGLLMFVNPQRPLGLSPVESSAAWYALAAIKLLLGAAGLACGIAALVKRRWQGGTGIARPCIGLGLSALHGISAFGLLLLPAKLGDPDTTPARFVLPGKEASVTFPSLRWRNVTDSSAADGQIVFAHTRLPLKAAVSLDRGSQAYFLRKCEAAKSALETVKGALADPYYAAGNRPDGAGYACAVACTRSPEGDSLLRAASLTRKADRIILVSVSGIATGLKPAEVIALGRKICMSVEFAQEGRSAAP